MIKMGEGVDVDGVGGVAPSLELLGDLLGVWWGEDANDPASLRESGR
jgi:hypothetical protein